MRREKRENIADHARVKGRVERGQTGRLPPRSRGNANRPFTRASIKSRDLLILHSTRFSRVSSLAKYLALEKLAKDTLVLVF